MHRQRDELLRVLLRRVSRTGEIRGGPSADHAGKTKYARYSPS